MDFCALFGTKAAGGPKAAAGEPPKNTPKKSRKKPVTKPSQSTTVAHSKFTPKKAPASPEPAPHEAPDNADVADDDNAMESAWDDAFTVEDFEEEENVEEVRDDTTDEESENYDAASMSESVAVSPELATSPDEFRFNGRGIRLTPNKIRQPTVLTGPALTFDDDSDIV
jgi:hypothetical protein